MIPASIPQPPTRPPRRSVAPATSSTRATPVSDPHASATPDLEQRIDEALRQSFPASDPPAWTLGGTPAWH